MSKLIKSLTNPQTDRQDCKKKTIFINLHFFIHSLNSSLLIYLIASFIAIMSIE